MKYYLGIDLGATNLRIALFDNDKKMIVQFVEKSTRDDKNLLYAQIKRMIEKTNYQNYNVQSIGISLCGQAENGIIIFAPNLKVTDLDLKGNLEKDFKLPVKIANDANASALAEAKYGIAKKYKTSLFTTISSGLGCGLIYDGMLINVPFEVGHQLITYKDNDYEVEHILSGTGIVKLASLNNLKVDNATDFFLKVASNDIKAKEILDDYVTLLAKFFFNLQVAFNVDCVILAGGMMKSKKYFFELLKKKTDEMLKVTIFKPLNFVDATFDQDAGIYGACAVAEF